MEFILSLLFIIFGFLTLISLLIYFIKIIFTPSLNEILLTWWTASELLIAITFIIYLIKVLIY